MISKKIVSMSGYNVDSDSLFQTLSAQEEQELRDIVSKTPLLLAKVRELVASLDFDRQAAARIPADEIEDYVDGFAEQLIDFEVQLRTQRIRGRLNGFVCSPTLFKNFEQALTTFLNESIFFTNLCLRISPVLRSAIDQTNAR